MKTKAKVPKKKSTEEGIWQPQQVSSPAELEPSGRVFQVQVPMLPPSGVIYEGDLAIFQAKIFDEEVWVVNPIHSPVNSLSVKEEGDLSLRFLQ